jgi:cytochrome P450 family 9
VVDIAANCFLVIFAGFDTVSTAIHFLGYELAMNPEVQSKLIQEIDDLNESLSGEDPSYEDIQKMEYMDMVVSEVLRKWPPATFQDRVCTKSYVLRDNDGTEVLLKPGDVALIPTLAIMRDPNYYSDPENFDPERFSLENRKNFNEFSYQPFGVGPRFFLLLPTWYF